MGGFGTDVIVLGQVSGIAFFILASLTIALQVILIVYLIMNMKK